MFQTQKCVLQKHDAKIIHFYEISKFFWQKNNFFYKKFTNTCMFAKKAVPLQRIVDCDTMAKEKPYIAKEESYIAEEIT